MYTVIIGRNNGVLVTIIEKKKDVREHILEHAAAFNSEVTPKNSEGFEAIDVDYFDEQEGAWVMNGQVLVLNGDTAVCVDVATDIETSERYVTVINAMGD